MATCKRECVTLAEERGGHAILFQATADFFDFAAACYNRVWAAECIQAPSHSL